MHELRHSKLSYELRGLIFETRNRLRMGWPEEVYHQGMERLCVERNVPVQSKPRRSVRHRGVEIQTLECDMLARDTAILEFKVLPNSKFAPRHYTQVINYLKCWKKDLGLLVNFGPFNTQIERVVWDEPVLQVTEDYDALASLSSEEQASLEHARQVILGVAEQHGLGYSDAIYRSMLAVEARHFGLACEMNATIPARWGASTLSEYQSDHLLLDGYCLLNVRALLDRPSHYDLGRTRTFMRALGLKLGLLVNFGKKQLHILALGSD